MPNCIDTETKDPKKQKNISDNYYHLEGVVKKS